MNTETRKSNELQIGKAGEYLVCADLIEKGLIAFPSEQGLPYDVVIDTGNKLVKCQVKTTTGPRSIPQRNKKSIAYIFNVKRHGKFATKHYHKNEVDIFALVCLDVRKVAYILNEEMPATLNIRVEKMRGTYYDEKGIKDYKKVIELKNIGKTQTETSAILGLHVATINRMWMSDYKPFESNARYLADFERSKEWFKKI